MCKMYARFLRNKVQKIISNTCKHLIQFLQFFRNDGESRIQGIASAGVHDIRDLQNEQFNDNDFGIQFRFFYKDDIYRHEGTQHFLKY